MSAPTEMALQIALDALNRIARCSEKDCEKYVAKVDAIAVAALVRIETWEA